MKDLLVIVPSRGRPDNARLLLKMWRTSTRADLVFVLDSDDPTLAAYPLEHCKVGEPAQFVAATNRIAVPAAERYPFLGSMTDKHLPRTDSWDGQIIGALERLGTGFAYPDDKMFHELIPTACFMTSDIVRALGFMALPELEHFACDNVWRDWGKALSRIRYMPDVVLEMMHASVGKGPMDATQIRSELLHQRDGDAYKQYLASPRFEQHVATLRALCG